MSSASKGSIVKKILIIFAIVVMLGLMSFIVWKYIFPHQNIFTSRPKTMSISAVIEREGASKLLTTEGGQIELAGETTKATLKLNKNSLLSSEMITLREIKTLETNLNEWKFITGVELTPDGINLLEAGQLEIDIPSGTNIDDLAGFSFDGGGKDFYLYPIEIKDNKAIFQLDGFSGYGLVNLGSYEPKTQPTEISEQALQLIDGIMRKEKNGMLAGADKLSKNALDSIFDILQGWYTTEVEKTLKAAQKDDILFEQAGYQFFKWLGRVQFFGLEGKFKKEINEANKLLKIGLANAVDKSSEKCIDEKDPLQTSKMLYLLGYAQLIGFDNTAAIEKKATKCAQFELRISSKIEETGEAFPDNPDVGKYSGTIPLKTSDSFSLSGTGQVKVDSYKKIVGSEFEHGCTYSKELIYPIEVPETQIKATGNKPNVSLLMTIKDPGDYEADCSYYIHGEAYIGNKGSAFGANFDLDFWDLHEDEITKIDEGDGSITFLLSNWEIVGKGGVFARKVYNRTKTFTHGLGTNKMKENTVFELIHKPQN